MKFKTENVQKCSIWKFVKTSIIKKFKRNIGREKITKRYHKRILFWFWGRIKPADTDIAATLMTFYFFNSILATQVNVYAHRTNRIRATDSGIAGSFTVPSRPLGRIIVSSTARGLNSFKWFARPESYPYRTDGVWKYFEFRHNIEKIVQRKCTPKTKA